MFVLTGGRFHTPVLDNTIKLPYLRTSPGTQKQKGQKKIPYLRTENLKNHTLFRGTYLYSPYVGVPPRAIFSLSPSEQIVHIDLVTVFDAKCEKLQCFMRI